MTARELTPDICVVGAGSGGLSVAAGARAFGASVVLVERGAMGGDCLNVGCVPSKALIAAARQARAVREAPAFGIGAGEPVVDMGRLRDHIRGVVAAIAPNDSVERFEALGVTVLRASGRFLDARRLLAGDSVVRPRRFVVATGSSPRLPDVPGIDAVPVLTNESVFDLAEVPRHLLVIGGGPTGLELAAAHRRLGAAVTVVDAGPLLPREDPELAAVVTEALQGEGVALHPHARILGLAPEPGGGIAMRLADAGGMQIRLVGSHLLAAAGRVPNLADLDLPAAGIAVDARGIAVGRDLRTSNRRAYAIGDVAGGPLFTHAANAQAALVLRAVLFRLPGRWRAEELPRVTFTDPDLAQVGATEAQARAAGARVEVLRVPLARIDRAQADRRTEGLLKLVVGPRGRLLGAGIVGAEAGELANLFSLALSRRMTLAALARFVSPYPTYGEIGKRAATAYYAAHAQAPLVRGLVRWLARFG